VKQDFALWGKNISRTLRKALQTAG